MFRFDYRVKMFPHDEGNIDRVFDQVFSTRTFYMLNWMLVIVWIQTQLLEGKCKPENNLIYNMQNNFFPNL